MAWASSQQEQASWKEVETSCLLVPHRKSHSKLLLLHSTHQAIHKSCPDSREGEIDWWRAAAARACGPENTVVVIFEKHSPPLISTFPHKEPLSGAFSHQTLLGLWFLFCSGLDPSPIFYSVPRNSKIKKWLHLVENIWEELYKENSPNKWLVCTKIHFQPGTRRKGGWHSDFPDGLSFYDFRHKHIPALHRELRFSSLKWRLQIRKIHSAFISSNSL